jgi:hypothetical protein
MSKTCQIGKNVACCETHKSPALICSECEHFKEEKMSFYEAWNKAEVGDGLRLYEFCTIIKSNGNGVRDTNGSDVNQGCLFEKEWTIIPKKKKVTKTIEIPEGAENVRLLGCNFSNYRGESFTQISYEIEE